MGQVGSLGVAGSAGLRVGALQGGRVVTPTPRFLARAAGWMPRPWAAGTAWSDFPFGPGWSEVSGNTPGESPIGCQVYWSGTEQDDQEKIRVITMEICPPHGVPATHTHTRERASQESSFVFCYSQKFQHIAV